MTATDDVDALLALKPDCVVYNPMFADVDELIRILGSGINVVTTSEFINGQHPGRRPRTDRRRMREKAARPSSAAASTLGSSSCSPIVTAGISDRVDRISIVESFDTTIYNSPATEIPMGFGYPIDTQTLPAITEKGSGIFREAVQLVADALGTELDDIRCEADYAQTTEDLVLPGDWTIGAGCVAGIDVRWKGIVDGRDVVEIRGIWTKGQSLEPAWSTTSATRSPSRAGRPSRAR